MRQRFSLHEPAGGTESLEVESQQRGRDEAVGFESVEVAEHILRLPIGDQFPIVHNQHTVRINDCQVNIVRDEQDRFERRKFPGSNP